MKNLILIIPKWLYPSNIGDTVVPTILPKVIKYYNPDCRLTVITSHEAIELYNDIKAVDKVELPSKEILKLNKDYFINSEVRYSVFPEWTADTFPVWNKNWDYLISHKEVNINALLYLQQNKLERIIFEKHNISLLPEITPTNCQFSAKNRYPIIGIVPAMKLAGRPNPHPGCDGIGYRLNGDSGETWKEVVRLLRQEYPNCFIMDFSSEANETFGDHRVKANSIKELAYYAKLCDIGIMSDGGIHHVFNSQKIPLILMDAQRINKPEFFALGNATILKQDSCRSKCESTIRSLTGWPDLINCCNKQCETLKASIITNTAIRILNDKNSHIPA